MTLYYEMEEKLAQKTREVLAYRTHALSQQLAEQRRAEQETSVVEQGEKHDNMKNLPHGDEIVPQNNPISGSNAENSSKKVDSVVGVDNDGKQVEVEHEEDDEDNEAEEEDEGSDSDDDETLESESSSASISLSCSDESSDSSEYEEDDEDDTTLVQDSLETVVKPSQVGAGVEDLSKDPPSFPGVSTGPSPQLLAAYEAIVEGSTTRNEPQSSASSKRSQRRKQKKGDVLSRSLQPTLYRKTLSDEYTKDKSLLRRSLPDSEDGGLETDVKLFETSKVEKHNIATKKSEAKPEFAVQSPVYTPLSPRPSSRHSISRAHGVPPMESTERNGHRSTTPAEARLPPRPRPRTVSNKTTEMFIESRSHTSASDRSTQKDSSNIPKHDSLVRHTLSFPGDRDSQVKALHGSELLQLSTSVAEEVRGSIVNVGIERAAPLYRPRSSNTSPARRVKPSAGAADTTVSKGQNTPKAPQSSKNGNYTDKVVISRVPSPAAVTKTNVEVFSSDSHQIPQNHNSIVDKTTSDTH